MIISADTSSWKLRQRKDLNYMYDNNFLSAVMRYFDWIRGIDGIRVYSFPPFCLYNDNAVRRYLHSCISVLSDVGLSAAKRGAYDLYSVHVMHLDRLSKWRRECSKYNHVCDDFVAIAPDVLGDPDATMKFAVQFAKYSTYPTLFVLQHKYPQDIRRVRDDVKKAVELGYIGIAIPSRYMPSYNGSIECSKHVDVCLKVVVRLIDAVVKYVGWIHLLGAPKKVLTSLSQMLKHDTL